MNIFKKFKQNINYLYNYHRNRATLIALAASGLLAFRQPSWQDLLIALPVISLASSIHIYRIFAGLLLATFLTVFMGEFRAELLLGIPAAFIVGCLLNGLIHNASHGNIRPRFINNAVGELCALVQLVGFAEWVIGHIIHHSHADDPEKDPHPPGNLGFIEYLAGVRANILKVLGSEYLKYHGRTPDGLKNLKKIGTISRVEHSLKVIFWYLVFGPQLFAFFFIPSIIFKMLVFAWLNFSAHRPDNGETRVFNRTQGFYKVLNIFTFNLFYHGNHHENPKLFNPRNYKSRTADNEYSSAA
jgi:fatty acid desaturase